MIKRFSKYYKPHMTLFLLDLIAALFISAVDLVFPIISKTFINDYIPNGQIDLIIKVASGILFLYILRMGATFFMGYWGHIVGARIEYDMRNDLFKHLQGLPFSFYDNNKTGQLMSRLVGDLGEIAELAHHGPEDLFISMITLIGSFIILMTINVSLTLLVFSFVLILILYALFSRKAMSRAFKKVRRKHADINSQIENSISGIRLSKSFANEENEIGKFKSGNKNHYLSKKEAYHAIAIFTTGTNFLVDIISLIVIVIGGVFVFKGLLNMGELVAYLLYSSYIFKPIRRLIQFTEQYQSGMAGFERFLEIMDIYPDIEDDENAIDLEHIEGKINLNKVSFRYNKESEWVLKNFDLSIEKGKNIALVGPSGVGKTTITNIIPRFYDINDGSITIDGKDIKTLTLKSLRKNIGIVQQDVIIFFGSIEENIRYGKLDASKEDIILAAKRANIHDFIVSLPEGYETIVGERGIKLSGGQKQRIAISRVFLKNPPILILDEATSSLDNENELAIQEAISELSLGRTTVTIAHRLSTIINADEILVLDGTGIRERGSHEELLNSKGVYFNLYKAQFKGYIPDQIQ
ncbi:MAG: ABC transporter ATP-binding protein [Clostridiales bacterium]|nr:ABC transporter ATP-binding protein [Clostridiales bacterium]